MENSVFDVAIVGAGIAGLAAARRAGELGLSIVVLEATDRIGGRIRSVKLPNGEWWEAGASALTQPPVNPLLAECERSGIPLNRTWSPPPTMWLNGERIPDSVADEIRYLIDEGDALLRELNDSDEDAGIGDLLDPSSPVRDLARAALRCDLFADPALFSGRNRFAQGSFEGSVYVSGALVEMLDRLFGDVEVRVNSPVRVIDYGGDIVRLDLDGDLIEARSVVVTVSTGVVVSGGIQFVPELGKDLTSAFRSLPMTQVTSAVLIPSGPIPSDFSASHHVLDDRFCGLAITIGPNNLNQIACLLGNSDLERDPKELIVEAVTQVTGMNTFEHLEVTDWATHEHILGGQAIALPIMPSPRQALSHPIADRVWFAGEATSRTAHGTMHGAMQSGIGAVNEIAVQFGILPPDTVIGDTDEIFRLPF